MDLGILLGFLGLVIGIWSVALTLKQRNRRSFSYQIVSSSPIVSVIQEVKSKVRVQFDGRIIEDAYQLILKIWNSGDTFAFIRPDEFTIPITFNFSNAEILGSPEIIDTVPTELQERVSLICDAKNQNVTLEPLLLNSKDSIKWRVLLTGFKGDIKVEGRIAGIKKIKRVDQGSLVTSPQIWLVDTIVSLLVRKPLKH